MYVCVRMFLRIFCLVYLEIQFGFGHYFHIAELWSEHTQKPCSGPRESVGNRSVLPNFLIWNAMKFSSVYENIVISLNLFSVSAREFALLCSCWLHAAPIHQHHSIHVYMKQ